MMGPMRRSTTLAVLAVLLAAGCSDGEPSGAAATTTSLPEPFFSTPSTTRPIPPIEHVEVEVVFFDEDADEEAEGFVAVRRLVRRGAEVRGALEQLFAGPSRAELDRGLRLVRSGVAGFRRVEVADQVARVFLAGGCRAADRGVTIAHLIRETLVRRPAVRYVKIFDSRNQTRRPDGPSHSNPACLDPLNPDLGE